MNDIQSLADFGERHPLNGGVRQETLDLGALPSQREVRGQAQKSVTINKLLLSTRATSDVVGVYPTRIDYRNRRGDRKGGIYL